MKVRLSARGVGQAALLPAGALAVHELRYLLAYGGGATVALQRQGHNYLHSVVPWVVLALALAAGGFLRALGRAVSAPRSAPRLAASFGALWLACTAALVAVFTVQELLEGALAAGHAAGWLGVFGYGGWWAVPAAACVGLVLAALLHGADWMLAEVARRWGASWRAPRVRRARPPRPVLSWPALPPAPLAAGWSDRGPPR